MQRVNERASSRYRLSVSPRDGGLVATAHAALLVSLIYVALYFGWPVLVPLAFSILIAFALSQLVRAMALQIGWDAGASTT